MRVDTSSPPRAAWLATSLCDSIAMVYEPEIRDAREMQLVDPGLLDVIAEARAHFLEDFPGEGDIFDRVSKEMLTAPPKRAAPVEQAAEGSLHKATLDDIAAALRDRLTFVDCVIEAADLAAEARLRHRELEASLRLLPNDRDPREAALHLAGACGEGPTVRLTPERGLLAWLRKLGELKVGDRAIDDAYIIDGEAAATELVRALRAPLLRVAPCREVAIQFGAGSLRASVAFREGPVSRVEAAVQLVELWRAAIDHRLGLD
jgi:hypothetical protein